MPLVTAIAQQCRRRRRSLGMPLPRATRLNTIPSLLNKKPSPQPGNIAAFCAVAGRLKAHLSANKSGIVMNRSFGCFILIWLIPLASGCILPVPHRRMHEWGVSGRILDEQTRAPVEAAKVVSGRTTTLSSADGSFSVAPVYSWHGAYLVGALSFSLLPALDMAGDPQPVISAPGYCDSKIDFDHHNKRSGAYIEVEDVLLERK